MMEDMYEDIYDKLNEYVYDRLDILNKIKICMPFRVSSNSKRVFINKYTVEFEDVPQSTGPKRAFIVTFDIEDEVELTYDNINKIKEDTGADNIYIIADKDKIKTVKLIYREKKRSDEYDEYDD